MHTNWTSRRIAHVFSPYLFYLLIFIAYTFPYVMHFTDHIIGKNDALQFAWNSFNFEQCLANGDLFFTKIMFHPWGEDSVLHAGGLFSNIFALPFDNKVLAENILLILHFILSGVGGYHVARYAGLNNRFALIAGFIFAFSPYKMARLAEHHNLVMMGFVPFFILNFLKAFRFTNFTFFPPVICQRNLILAIFFGFIQGLSDFVVMFHLLYFAAFIVLFSYIKRYQKYYGLIPTFILILIITVYCHILSQSLVQSGADDSGGLWWGGYWSDFIRPDGSIWYNYVFGDKPSAIFSRYNMGLESQVFLGYSLIAASSIALWQWFNSKSSFILNAFFFALVCCILVAVPEPFGYKHIYSPFAFLHFIPVLTELRCPERIFSIAYLCLSVFVLCQIQNSAWLQRKKRQFFTAAFLFVALFIEYFPEPYSFTSITDIPVTVRELRKTAGEGTLIYPFGLRDGYSQIGHYEMVHAVYQMHHQKKQLGGYISRISDDLRNKYSNNSFIRDLVIMQSSKDTALPIKDYEGSIDSLHFSTALILHKERIETGATFLDSILVENGYTVKKLQDGYLYTKY